MSFMDRIMFFLLSAITVGIGLIIHYYLGSGSDRSSTAEKTNNESEVTKLTSKQKQSSVLVSSESSAVLRSSKENNDYHQQSTTIFRMSSSSYKPRGALARTVYEKVHNDQYLDGYDMKLWYKLQKPLKNDKYQSKFIQIDQPDDITLYWLDEAKHLSANFWLQLWHIVARMFLTTFMTQTDVNGYLKRGSMFILSELQFQQLLTAGGFQPNKYSVSSSSLSSIEGGKNSNSDMQMIDMLDIGAGDGEVTSRLAKSIIHMGENVQLKVYATEFSWTMRNRLQKMNFIVIDKLKDVANVHLISCLNVLDRCADPHQILNDIYTSLAPNGRAIIALVLPYSHYVESNTSHLPIKPLLPHWPNETNLPFHDEANTFFEQLESMGFVIEAWTKAPYLCEGDLRQSFYWLIDVVVVLSKRSSSPQPPPPPSLSNQLTKKNKHLMATNNDIDDVNITTTTGGTIVVNDDNNENNFNQ